MCGGAATDLPVQVPKVAIISGGWDTGMFSVMRLYANTILPKGNTYWRCNETCQKWRTKTIFDIFPVYLAEKSRGDLIKELL